MLYEVITGNPLACTAALATLELFEQNDILAMNEKKSHYILSATDVITSYSIHYTKLYDG